MTVYALNSDKQYADAIATMKPDATFATFDAIVSHPRPYYQNDAIVADRDLTDAELEEIGPFKIAAIVKIKTVEEAENFWRKIAREYEAMNYSPFSHHEKVEKLSFPMRDDDVLWLSRKYRGGLS